MQVLINKEGHELDFVTGLLRKHLVELSQGENLAQFILACVKSDVRTNQKPSG